MDYLMNDEKHYITLNNYLRDKYNDKVFRVSLNAGFTCPNRDGFYNHLGCSYCSEKLSGDFAGSTSDNLKTQFEKGLILESKKWQSNTYIAYLQAGSNTYGDPKYLLDLYSSIININENIKILAIATRPDCINQDIVDVLKEINKKIEVWIELGFQTSNELTAQKINRCYNNKVFIDAFNLLNSANIKVIVHIINGLPYDTKDDMINTVLFLRQFPLFGIKIHMLHVLKNSRLGDEYQCNPFNLLTLNEFVEITVEQLRLLPTSIVVHRLTGDAPKDLLLAPFWTLKKFVVLNEIDKYMRKHNYYQGDLCKKLQMSHTY